MPDQHMMMMIKKTVMMMITMITTTTTMMMMMTIDMHPTPFFNLSSPDRAAEIESTATEAKHWLADDDDGDDDDDVGVEDNTQYWNVLTSFNIQ